MNMTQLYRISEKTLTGERIHLVPQGEEHAGEMFDVLNDSSLHQFTGGTPPESVHALRKRFARLATRMSPDQSEMWLNWVIITDETRHYIGYVQATVSEMVADIAWVIGRAYQGKGYGTEAAGLMMAALKEAGIRSFTSHIRNDHLASQQLAAKLGLSVTGIVENGEDVWRLDLS